MNCEGNWNRDLLTRLHLPGVICPEQGRLEVNSNTLRHDYTWRLGGWRVTVPSSLILVLKFAACGPAHFRARLSDEHCDSL